jgi:hypothetical protein
MARLAFGSAGWLLEFRRFSIAFMAFDRGGSSRNEVPADIDSLARPALAAIDRYGGIPLEMVADDKGLMLMSAFGLPPNSHEDDAARACLAVVSATRALGARGTTLHAGIATGRVFCGIVGSAERRHYAVVGPATNLAARLAALRQGLLVDERTQAAAGVAVAAAPRDAVLLKGFTAPVPIYALSTGPVPESRGRAKGPRQLVGRVPELSSLDKALALAANAPTVLWITGPAGIGKTSLAGTLEERATARGWHHLAIHGRPGGSGRPFEPWLAVLPELADRADDSAAGFLVAAAVRHRAGEHPLVLVVDAADEIDMAAWTVVEHLLRGGGPMLLLMVARVHPGSALPASLRSQLERLPGITLPLGPLAPADGTRIAANLMGVETLPTWVAALVETHAGGHPLYAELVARSLLEADIVRVEDGRCLISMTHETAPDDIAAAFRAPDESHALEALIVSRIDRLQPEVQITLRCASACGPEFSRQALAEVHPDGVDPSDLNRHLAALVTADFITPADPPDVYRFAHTSVQEVTYATLPFELRAVMHRRVAEWLDRHEPEAHAALAHHWNHAREPGRAAPHFARAGIAFHQAGAYPEAVRHLRDALDRLPPRGQEAENADWEGALGRAYVAWSRYLEGRTHLIRALALQRVRVPRSTLGAAAALASELARRLAPVRSYSGEPRRQRARTQVQALEALTETFYLTNQALHCLWAAVRGLTLAEHAGPCPELARTLSSAATIASLVPWDRKANELAARAQHLAGELDSDATRVWVNLAVGVFRLGRGRWMEAEALFADALRRAEALGDERRACDIRISQGALALLRGTTAPLDEISARIYESGERRGDWRSVSIALDLRGLGQIRERRWHELQATARELAAVRARDSGLSAHEQETDLLLFDGYIAASEHQWSEAETFVDRAASRLYSSPATHWDLVVYLVHATDLCRRLARRAARGTGTATVARALRRLQRPLRSFRRVFPIGEPAVAQWHAVRCELDGRIEASSDYWRRCHEAAVRLEMGYEAMLARTEGVGGSC